ncbi:transposase [Streptomyces sp. NPDC051183]|uniref:transposase n=1 Tax=Streptomyces sp. NPDC051183 TaxID=3155165 RepID=UPI003415849E
METRHRSRRHLPARHHPERAPGPPHHLNRHPPSRVPHLLPNIASNPAGAPLRSKQHSGGVSNRADQQDPTWRRLYASRSGIEGTVNEIVNGHQMRRCRYRGTPKSPRPARPDGHRRQHRTPQHPGTHRHQLPAPPSDHVPAIPRRPRSASAPLLAPSTVTLANQDHRQSRSSSPAA